MILLDGMKVFLGPLAGAAILLLLNDTVTRLTEHYSLVLGIVILVFALGLRSGLLGLVADLLAKRAARARRTGQTPAPAQAEQR
jgi:branched-chain amino acid transport system permease protein